MSCFFGTSPETDDEVADSDDADTDTDDGDNNARSAGGPFVLRVAVGSTNPSKVEAVRCALERALAGAAQARSAAGVLSPLRPPAAALDLQAFSVSSGVPEQPVGDAETLAGARARARAAHRAYRAAHSGAEPHLAVAVEGGLEWVRTAVTESRGGATSNGNGAHHDKIEASVGDADGQGTSSAPTDASPTPPTLFCTAWVAVYGRRTGPLLERLCDVGAVPAHPGDRRPVCGVARAAAFPLPPALAALVVEQGLSLGAADNALFGRSDAASSRGQGTVGLLTGGLLPRALYYEPAVLLALTMWIRPDVYPTGF